MNLYKVILIASGLLFSLYSGAQQKQSYTILKDGQPIVSTQCSAALNNIIIDSYRFSDTRRTIKVVNEAGAYLYDVILFSGQELKAQYGKQISPLNKLQSAGSQICELVLFSDGALKVKTCK